MRTSVCRAFCFVLLLGLILLTGCRPDTPAAALPRTDGEPKASEAVALPDSNALVRVWTTADGLPVNFVEDIAQTPDGYLWLATSAGLVRFDGVRFRLYGQEDLTGWTNTYVKRMHVDRRGRLFIASSLGDVSVIENGRVRLLAPMVRSRDLFFRYSEAQGFVEAPDGSVWAILAKAGALRVDRAGGVERFDAPGGEDLYALHVFPSGVVVGATRQHLVRLQGDRFVPFGPAYENADSFPVWQTPDSFYVSTWSGVFTVTEQGYSLRRVPTYRGRSRLVLVRPDGSWIVRSDAGVELLSSGRVAPGSSRVLVSGDQIHDWDSEKSVQPLNDRVILWVSKADATGRQETRMLDEGEREERLALPEGLEINILNRLLPGRNGAWWGATSGGLVRIVPRRATAIGRAEGLTGPELVFTTLVGPDSNLYVGSWGGGLLQRTPVGVIRRIPKAIDYIRALLFDRQGRLWAAGADPAGQRGLAILGKGSLLESLNGAEAILQRKDGRVYVAAGEIFQMEERAPGHFLPRELPLATNQSARALHEDRRGRLWAGTGNGLFVQFPGDTTWHRHPAVGGHIMNLYEDARGDFLLGTRGAGLIRLYGASTADDPVRVRTFTYTRAQHGLHHDGIWWVQPDRGGYLWMTSDMGLGKYTQQMLDDVADGRAARLSPLVLTQADGLPSDEFNSGQPGGTIDARGVMYFPTLKGVAVVDPRNVRPDSTPPPVVLQEVTVDGVVRDTIPAQFPPGTRNLAFRYAALDLVRPEGTRYRVRLDGFDPDWVEMGSRREAVYSNLPPGRYTFRVRGMNGDGTWNEAGAARAFAIAPHWWQTLWARLGLLLGVMGLGYAGWRFQTNRMRTVELAAMVDERTAELRAERDTVAAQRAELAAQHTALQTLDRLKADLVASVSHEFRTPLMLVLGHLEDVLRRDALGADD